MAYIKTAWVDEGPPAISAANLNKIETGIYNNATDIDAIETDVTALKTAYVVSNGSATNWKWRKYSDGTFDAWYTGTETSAISSGSGSFYYVNGTFSIPSGIGATAITFVTVQYDGGELTFAKVGTVTTSSIQYALISSMTRSSQTRNIKAYLHGTYA